MSKICPCGSGFSFSDCCQPFLLKIQNAPTAEALMRSRYTAYVIQNADYLIETTAEATRKYHKKADILNWSKNSNWIRLEILFSSETIVEFKAFYFEKMQLKIHHERSKFVNETGKWFYLEHE